MVCNGVHNVFLNTLTVGTPFACVPIETTPALFESATVWTGLSVCNALHVLFRL